MTSENDTKKPSRALGFVLIFVVVLVCAFSLTMATEHSAPIFLRAGSFVILIAAGFAAVKIYKKYDLKSPDSPQIRRLKNIRRLAIAYTVATVVAIYCLITHPSWMAASQVGIGTLLTYGWWRAWKQGQGPDVQGAKAPDRNFPEGFPRSRPVMIIYDILNPIPIALNSDIPAPWRAA